MRLSVSTAAGRAKADGPMRLSVSTAAGRVKADGPVRLSVSTAAGRIKADGPVRLSVSTAAGRAKADGPVRLSVSTAAGRAKADGPVRLSVSTAAGRVKADTHTKEHSPIQIQSNDADVEKLTESKRKIEEDATEKVKEMDVASGAEVIAKRPRKGLNRDGQEKNGGAERSRQSGISDCQSARDVDITLDTVSKSVGD